MDRDKKRYSDKRKSGFNRDVRHSFKKNNEAFDESDAAQPDENIVFGRNSVKEALEGEREIEKIYVASGEREGSIKLIIGMAKERGVTFVECEKAKLDKLSQGGKHQGVVAVIAERSYSTVDEILAYAEERGEPPFVVVCDGIEDPHNLGAIIRSAECCGAHGVIIPKRRAVGLTTTVSKASAGAIEHIRIAKVTNMAATLEELKERGLWIYGADMDGTAYYSTDMKGAAAVVVGSEGFGMSRLVKEKCDFIVSIPLYGQINSMNVSCATAVILAEVAKQRNGREG